MKRNTQLPIVAILISLLALAGCQNLFQQKLGSVQLTVASAEGSKSILPSSMGVTTYRLSGIGPSNATLSSMSSTNGSFTIQDLAAGSWTLTAQGLDASNNVLMSGSTTVAVQASATTAASITMSPATAGSGSLSLSLACQGTSTTIKSITGKLSPDSGSAISLTFSIATSSATCTQSGLTPGSYILSLSVATTSQVSRLITDTVLIYNGRTSSGSFSLSDSDFQAGYSVAYDANGDNAKLLSGGTAPSGTAPIDSTAYGTGQDVTIADNTGSLALSGFAFAGWNTKADGSGTSYAPGSKMTMGSSSTTLYALYNTLAYDKNGATSGYAPVVATYVAANTTVTVKGNPGSLARTGYSFSGWNTAADGSGTTYVEGATFTKASGATTLYALWTKVYTVSYVASDATGGSVPTDSTNYLKSATVTVLGNTGSLTKTGYVFAGWNTAADGTGTSYIGGKTFSMGSADVTLYVVWSHAASSAIQCGDHSFIMAGDGSVWAMGKNTYGQLGTGGSSSQQNSPVKLSETGITQISGNYIQYWDYGWSYLLKGSYLYGCGRNYYGVLGLGSTATQESLGLVLNGVSAVSASPTHALILMTDGSLYATGFNTYGQLGLGDTTTRTSPTLVSSMSDVKAVYAGPGYSMILKKNGSLWACGDNRYGQLATSSSSSTAQTTPVQVMSGVASVATGGFHVGDTSGYYVFTLIVKTDGSLWACGYNECGQLGNGTTTAQTAPVEIIASGVASVSAGARHSLILKTDGTLWACGDGYYGQLATGTTANQTTPVQVMSEVASVSAGGYYLSSAVSYYMSSSLIVKKDGSLWACGRNDLGQLGLGTTIQYTTVTQVVF